MPSLIHMQPSVNKCSTLIISRLVSISELLPKLPSNGKFFFILVSCSLSLILIELSSHE